jgi:cytoskeletal protein RodZ
MKKRITLVLGLAFALSNVAMTFAQGSQKTDTSDQNKTSSSAKKKKKKKTSIEPQPTGPKTSPGSSSQPGQPGRASSNAQSPAPNPKSDKTVAKAGKPSAKSLEDSTNVFVDTTANTYHMDRNCVKAPAGPTLMTLTEAKRRGFRQCKSCRRKI